MVENRNFQHLVHSDSENMFDARRGTPNRSLWTRLVNVLARKLGVRFIKRTGWKRLIESLLFEQVLSSLFLPLALYDPFSLLDIEPLGDVVGLIISIISNGCLCFLHINTKK